MSDNIAPDIRFGAYRHYKGGIYFVHNLAWHTESGEWLVVYSQTEPPYSCWAQGIDRFNEKVIHNQKEQQKFEFLSYYRYISRGDINFFGHWWERE